MNRLCFGSRLAKFLRCRPQSVDIMNYQYIIETNFGCFYRDLGQILPLKFSPDLFLVTVLLNQVADIYKFKTDGPILHRKRNMCRHSCLLKF